MLVGITIMSNPVNPSTNVNQALIAYGTQQRLEDLNDTQRAIVHSVIREVHGPQNEYVIAIEEPTLKDYIEKRIDLYNEGGYGSENKLVELQPANRWSEASVKDTPNFNNVIAFDAAILGTDSKIDGLPILHIDTQEALNSFLGGDYMETVEGELKVRWSDLDRVFCGISIHVEMSDIPYLANVGIKQGNIYIFHPHVNKLWDILASSEPAIYRFTKTAEFQTKPLSEIEYDNILTNGNSNRKLIADITAQTLRNKLVNVNNLESLTNPQQPSQVAKEILTKNLEMIDITSAADKFSQGVDHKLWRVMDPRYLDWAEDTKMGTVDVEEYSRFDTIHKLFLQSDYDMAVEMRELFLKPGVVENSILAGPIDNTPDAIRDYLSDGNLAEFMRNLDSLASPMEVMDTIKDNASQFALGSSVGDDHLYEKLVNRLGNTSIEDTEYIIFGDKDKILWKKYANQKIYVPSNIANFSRIEFTAHYDPDLGRMFDFGFIKKRSLEFHWESDITREQMVARERHAVMQLEYHLYTRVLKDYSGLLSSQLYSDGVFARQRFFDYMWASGKFDEMDATVFRSDFIHDNHEITTINQLVDDAYTAVAIASSFSSYRDGVGDIELTNGLIGKVVEGASIVEDAAGNPTRINGAELKKRYLTTGSIFANGKRLAYVNASMAKRGKDDPAFLSSFDYADADGEPHVFVLQDSIRPHVKLSPREYVHRRFNDDLMIITAAQKAEDFLDTLSDEEKNKASFFDKINEELLLLTVEELKEHPHWSYYYNQTIADINLGVTERTSKTQLEQMGIRVMEKVTELDSDRVIYFDVDHWIYAQDDYEQRMSDRKKGAGASITYEIMDRGTSHEKLVISSIMVGNSPDKRLQGKGIFLLEMLAKVEGHIMKIDTGSLTPDGAALFAGWISHIKKHNRWHEFPWFSSGAQIRQLGIAIDGTGSNVPRGEIYNNVDMATLDFQIHPLATYIPMSEWRKQIMTYDTPYYGVRALPMDDWQLNPDTNNTYALPGDYQPRRYGMPLNPVKMEQKNALRLLDSIPLTVWKTSDYVGLDEISWESDDGIESHRPYHQKAATIHMVMDVYRFSVDQDAFGKIEVDLAEWQGNNRLQWIHVTGGSFQDNASINKATELPIPETVRAFLKNKRIIVNPIPLKTRALIPITEKVVNQRSGLVVGKDKVYLPLGMTSMGRNWVYLNECGITAWHLQNVEFTLTANQSALAEIREHLLVQKETKHQGNFALNELISYIDYNQDVVIQERNTPLPDVTRQLISDRIRVPETRIDFTNKNVIGFADLMTLGNRNIWLGDNSDIHTKFPNDNRPKYTPEEILAAWILRAGAIEMPNIKAYQQPAWGRSVKTTATHEELIELSKKLVEVRQLGQPQLNPDSGDVFEARSELDLIVNRDYEQRKAYDDLFSVISDADIMARIDNSLYITQHPMYIMKVNDAPFGINPKLDPGNHVSVAVIHPNDDFEAKRMKHWITHFGQAITVYQLPAGTAIFNPGWASYTFELEIIVSSDTLSRAHAIPMAHFADINGWRSSRLHEQGWYLSQDTNRTIANNDQIGLIHSQAAALILFYKTQQTLDNLLIVMGGDDFYRVDLVKELEAPDSSRFNIVELTNAKKILDARNVAWDGILEGEYWVHQPKSFRNSVGEFSNWISGKAWLASNWVQHSIPGMRATAHNVINKSARGLAKGGIAIEALAAVWFMEDYYLEHGGGEVSPGNQPKAVRTLPGGEVWSNVVQATADELTTTPDRASEFRRYARKRIYESSMSDPEKESTWEYIINHWWWDKYEWIMLEDLGTDEWEDAYLANEKFGVTPIEREWWGDQTDATENPRKPGARAGYGADYSYTQDYTESGMDFPERLWTLGHNSISIVSTTFQGIIESIAISGGGIDHEFELGISDWLQGWHVSDIFINAINWIGNSGEGGVEVRPTFGAALSSIFNSLTAEEQAEAMAQWTARVENYEPMQIGYTFELDNPVGPVQPVTVLIVPTYD